MVALPFVWYRYHARHVKKISDTTLFLIRGLSAGALDDRESDVNDRFGHRTALRPIDDAARRKSADCRTVDTDRCQRRHRIRREVEIAIADHSDPFGHRNAASLGFDHSTERKHVRTAEYRVDSRMAGKQLRHTLAAAAQRS